MSHIINYKSKEIELEFNHNLISATLVAVVYQMAVYAYSKWGLDLTITEVWRDKQDVHGDWRAVDIRNWSFTKSRALELANWINDKAPYDPNRPERKTCIVYELDPNGKHDDHFHVQVHPNTVISLS